MGDVQGRDKVFEADDRQRAVSTDSRERPTDTPPHGGIVNAKGKQVQPESGRDLNSFNTTKYSIADSKDRVQVVPQTIHSREVAEDKNNVPFPKDRR